MINNKMKVTMTVILILSLVTFGVYGIGNDNVSIEKDNEIKISINDQQIELDNQYLINGKLFVPIRDVFEKIGSVKWVKEDKTVRVTTYNNFAECDYTKGEHFIYGVITDIDLDKGTLLIEQHFDDNSKEVIQPLFLNKETIIMLERNDKRMNLDIKDLKCGDGFGAVLDRDNWVKGMILTF